MSTASVPAKTGLETELSTVELSCEIWDDTAKLEPLFHCQKQTNRIRGLIRNTLDRSRVLNLRLDSISPLFSHRVASFGIVPRTTPESLGGSEVDLLDRELFEGRECQLLFHSYPDARAFDIVINAAPQLGARAGRMEVRLLIEEQIEDRVIVLEEHNLVFDLRHPNGRLLGMLPQIYQDEESTEQSSFFSRYLLGFEEFIDQTNRELDTVHHFFSAFGAPNEFLTWLAQWVAIAGDLPIPEIRKRKLISEAVALYRIRGTKAGLSRLLEIGTGVKPIIRDKPTEGFKLGARSRMGASTTRLGNINEGTFTVVVPSLEPSRLNHEVVKRLIEAYKPAHTRFKFRIVRTIAGETLAAAIKEEGSWRLTD